MLVGIKVITYGDRCGSIGEGSLGGAGDMEMEGMGESRRIILCFCNVKTRPAM